MEKIKLEKPKVDVKLKNDALRKFSALESGIRRKYFISSIDPKYLYWDKVKYHVPPKGLTIEETWIATREMRKTFSRDTYVHQEDGTPFSFLSLSNSDKWHHEIDVAIGGGIFAPYSTISEQNKQKFLSNGLIEEAIASSQLEGANTSRKAARKMIFEKREPSNRSEIMIINNYKAMQLIENDFKDRELSPELLLELHNVITDNDPQIKKSERGRFRTDKDEIVVVNESKQMIAHEAPSEKFLKKEMLRLIEYANDEDSGSFTHPVIKAIFLHFWIGYLHPFTDGNGRVARTIFYWYLLRKNYWGIAYLPISTMIKKSSTQYGNAYLYAEQDQGDITYFYDYHIRKIIEAIEEFQKYVDRKIAENREIDKKVSKESTLNDRQKQLLHFLLSEIKGVFTTINTHSAIYNVSRVTADKDLRDLEKLGYLKSKKIGKEKQFYVMENLR